MCEVTLTLVPEPGAEPAWAGSNAVQNEWDTLYEEKTFMGEPIRIEAPIAIFTRPNKPKEIWQNVSFYTNFVSIWPAAESSRELKLDGWACSNLELTHDPASVDLGAHEAWGGDESDTEIQFKANIQLCCCCYIQLLLLR